MCIKLCIHYNYNIFQGSLDPYERKVLKMVFSPQFEKSSLGWTRHQSIPIHKDYALFVQFLRIGASNVNVSLGKSYIRVSYIIYCDVDFHLKAPL